MLLQFLMYITRCLGVYCVNYNEEIKIFKNSKRHTYMIIQVATLLKLFNTVNNLQL